MVRRFTTRKNIKGEIAISPTYSVMSLYCQPFGPITSFLLPCLQYHQNSLSHFLISPNICPGCSSPNFSLDISLLLSPILGTALCHQNLCPFHRKMVWSNGLKSPICFYFTKIGRTKGQTSHIITTTT